MTTPMIILKQMISAIDAGLYTLAHQFLMRIWGMIFGEGFWKLDYPWWGSFPWHLLYNARSRIQQNI
tara:strand:- start:26 stop:226 length:201 start_codon:yes stop_codon:yes gene_type:complete